MHTITISIDRALLDEVWALCLRWQTPLAEAAPRLRRPYCRTREKRQARQILRECGLA